jgi:hypothetical protein
MSMHFIGIKPEEIVTKPNICPQALPTVDSGGRPAATAKAPASPDLLGRRRRPRACGSDGRLGRSTRLTPSGLPPLPSSPPPSSSLLHLMHLPAWMAAAGRRCAGFASSSPGSGIPHPGSIARRSNGDQLARSGSWSPPSG